MKQLVQEFQGFLKEINSSYTEINPDPQNRLSSVQFVAQSLWFCTRARLPRQGRGQSPPGLFSCAPPEFQRGSSPARHRALGFQSDETRAWRRPH